MRDFFAGAPFKLTVDASQSVRAIVRGLTAQAIKRQKDMPGVMFLGTMMQHLVGAKLQVILGIENVSHHCSNQNDIDASRTGDFDLGDVTIHVTSSPTESLLQKCADNLSDDLRPIIVTTGKGVTTAEVLAENIGIALGVKPCTRIAIPGTHVSPCVGCVATRNSPEPCATLC